MDITSYFFNSIFIQPGRCIIEFPQLCETNLIEIKLVVYLTKSRECFQKVEKSNKIQCDWISLLFIQLICNCNSVASDTNFQCYSNEVSKMLMFCFYWLGAFY